MPTARATAFHALLLTTLAACHREGAALAPMPRNAEARLVTLLHMTDYHSHATPFASEGRRDQGGIARLLGYAKSVKSEGHALVLSGGDMLNKKTPAWSDKYRCVEWPWLDGVVDAMAFGNHDADYGYRAFAACRASVRYPVLAANVVDASGARIFDDHGAPYAVRDVNGVKIGLFALAGPDFPGLLSADALPSGAHVEDRAASLERARAVVSALHTKEHVDLVVFLGHEEADADAELAKSVSGIDLVFGSHAHTKVPFGKIQGTGTYTLGAFQYGAYMARVDCTFGLPGQPPACRGALVAMDEAVPTDSATAAKVAELEARLEADPLYASRFVVVGNLPANLEVDGVVRDASPLASFVLDAVRDAAHADVAFMGASSFRAPLTKGPVRRDDILTALPYPNRIETFLFTGAQLDALMAARNAHVGTNAFLAGSKLPEPRDGARTYLVATTDFTAHNAASPYRAIFEGAPSDPRAPKVTQTVAEIVEAQIAASSRAR